MYFWACKPRKSALDDLGMALGELGGAVRRGIGSSILQGANFRNGTLGKPSRIPMTADRCGLVRDGGGGLGAGQVPLDLLAVLALFKITL